jgi:O-antigen ligase
MSTRALATKNVPSAISKDHRGAVVITRKAFLVVFFFISLYPYSISLGGDGLSANYSFVLFPLFWSVLHGGVVKRPKTVYLLLMGGFWLIFLVAAVYQIAYQEYAARRFVSFALFMTMFSYMFVEIDADVVAAFKIAIVLISVYFCLDQLATYTLAGGSELGSLAKDVVGSARYGFIYILALWIAYQGRYAGRLWKVCKYPTVVVLLIGLLLTFSRASMVALLGGFGIFTVFGILARANRPRQLFSVPALTSVVILAGILFSLIRFVPGPVGFFEERFQFFLNEDALGKSLENPQSSEGGRVFLVEQVLDFVQTNPFTGSGYLGVWILFDDGSGSTHNQYTDVLFRTGPLGLAAYLYLLVALLRYLFANERALFWGIVGVLIYGLFHETFKESQGAFVLAFLLGLMSQRRPVVDTRRPQLASIQHGPRLTERLSRTSA